jgi:hypothetical protein
MRRSIVGFSFSMTDSSNCEPHRGSAKLAPADRNRCSVRRAGSGPADTVTWGVA